MIPFKKNIKKKKWLILLVLFVIGYYQISNRYLTSDLDLGWRLG